MKKELVEMYSEESNFVVLRTPARRYPGVLIQGDSLGGIVDELKTAIELFASDREESLDCLELAFNELKWRLEGYKKVCHIY